MKKKIEAELDGKQPCHFCGGPTEWDDDTPTPTGEWFLCGDCYKTILYAQTVVNDFNFEEVGYV